MKNTPKIGNVQLMQKINRARVFEYIRQNANTTRPAIAADTGLSLSSITNIVTYLLDKGLVAEKALESAGHVGRKASLLGVNDAKYRIACISIEVDDVRATCVDLCGNVVYEHPVDTCHYHGSSAVDMIVSRLEELIEKGGGESVVAIGVAIPGMVLNGGRKIFSVGLKWNGFDLKSLLSEKFGRSVFIQNSSIARAMWVLSEIRRGQSELPSAPNAVFLDLQQGIGAVQFTNNRINPWMIGEFGHLTVDPNGSPCTCGNIGCLEQMCSPEKAVSDAKTAIENGKCRILAKLITGKNEITFADICAASDAGDADAADILRTIGQYLGIGITNVINTLHPTILYFNGHTLLRSKLVFHSAVEWVAEHAMKELVSDVIYQPVPFEEYSALVGITEYAQDKLFDIDSKHCIID